MLTCVVQGMMDDGELSPYKRRSSTSDDSSSEEGQVTKYDENEATAAAHKKESELTREDLERVRLTRDMLVKHCHSPFFEEYVKSKLLPSLWPRNDFVN